MTERREALASSMARRVNHENDASNSVFGGIWYIIAVIVSTIAVVNVTSFAIVEYGIFGGDTESVEGGSAMKCFSSLEKANFDLMKTKRYDEWFGENSVLQLAQTGTYLGPANIQEYAEFIFMPMFQHYKRVAEFVATPISLTEDECVINFVTNHEIEMNIDYPGIKPVCIQSAVSFTMHFQTDPNFMITRLNLWYPDEFLKILFGELLDAGGVHDWFCDILENDCQDTFSLNNLSSASCREKFDALPKTNEFGSLDDNSKGCRILHAAFAKKNENYCPHLSFIPQQDKNGETKCQTSKNVKPEDLFSEYELERIHEIPLEQKWLPNKLYRYCNYPSSSSELGNDGKDSLGITDPLGGLTMSQYLTYLSFIFWATMVLTGLGTEFFVFKMFINGEWDERKEYWWKLAQFLFPLMGATTVGLANTHNYLAFPFLVVTMWKFGFPETILLLHNALFVTTNSIPDRIADFMAGVGVIIHHETCALYVAVVVSGLIPTNRQVVQVTIPLLMQHLVVLLKYKHKIAYSVIETLIEVWVEWNAFAVLEVFHELHWTGGMIIGTILFAHWMYFGSAILRIANNIMTKSTNDPNRYSFDFADERAYFKQLKILSSKNLHLETDVVIDSYERRIPMEESDQDTDQRKPKVRFEAEDSSDETDALVNSSPNMEKSNEKSNQQCRVSKVQFEAEDSI